MILVSDYIVHLDGCNYLSLLCLDGWLFNLG